MKTKDLTKILTYQQKSLYVISKDLQNFKDPNLTFGLKVLTKCGIFQHKFGINQDEIFIYLVNFTKSLLGTGSLGGIDIFQELSNPEGALGQRNLFTCLVSIKKVTLLWSPHYDNQPQSPVSGQIEGSVVASNLSYGMCLQKSQRTFPGSTKVFFSPGLDTRKDLFIQSRGKLSSALCTQFPALCVSEKIPVNICSSNTFH